MSALTEMLGSALMAAVAWAGYLGLPLCAAMSAAPVAEDTANTGVLPQYKKLGKALRWRSVSNGPIFAGLSQRR
jgi:hypothetical protein